MLRVIITIFALSLLLTVSVLGFQLYQGVNMSQTAYELNQRVQELRLQKELAEVKRQTQKDAIEYNLTKAKMQQNVDVITSGPVRSARILGSATLYAWPVFCVLAITAGGVLFAYSRRQTTIQEVEKSRNALLISEEQAALKVMEKVAPAIARSVAASIPRQASIMPPVEAVEVSEPAALRAFSGPVYFSQAKLDPDYDERLIMWGRDTETGGIRQQALEDVESLCINGIQKAGKSTLLEAIAHNSLLRQYVYGESVRTVLIDLHAGAPRDSLSKKLESYCPNIGTLFHRAFLGEPDIEDGLVTYFDELFESFRPEEDPDAAELVIVFDEYTETVSNLTVGKDIEARVKRLFNRRKYGVRLVLAMFESSKNAQSAKGLNVSKMAVSKALFRMDSAEGKRFLRDADGCQTLDKGEYLLMTPGELESSRIQGPLFSSIDFQVFQQFTRQAEPEDESNPMAITPEGREDEITPQRAKDLMKESLSKTAKETGIPKSTLSNFLNKKGQLSDVQIAALRAYLIPDQKNVISLNERREALSKRA